MHSTYYKLKQVVRHYGSSNPAAQLCQEAVDEIDRLHERKEAAEESAALEKSEAREAVRSAQAALFRAERELRSERNESEMLRDCIRLLHSSHKKGDGGLLWAAIAEAEACIPDLITTQGET